MADARWFPLEGYRDAIMADLDLALRVWEDRGVVTPGRASRLAGKAFQKSLMTLPVAFDTFGREFGLLPPSP